MTTRLEPGGSSGASGRRGAFAGTPTDGADEPRGDRASRPRSRWLGSLAGVVLVSVVAGVWLLAPRPRVAHASVGNVELAVTAPARLRYRVTDWVTVDVRNPSSEPLESVTVEVDTRFVEGLAQASFTPTPAWVDEQRYVVALGRLGPGDSRRVTVQVQAEVYGRRLGSISAVAGRSRVVVPVEVFVLP